MKYVNQIELNRIVGQNIKKYRLNYSKNNEKMTQEKLSELINVSIYLIRNLESNKIKQGISISNLYKISVVLDVPINKFFEDNDE